jgi:hypothetical protein
MPNRRARRLKERKILHEQEFSSNNVLHLLNNKLLNTDEILNLVPGMDSFMSSENRERATRRPRAPRVEFLSNDDYKYGVEHAIEVVLGEYDACPLARTIYESGLLMCVSVFLDHSRSNGVFTKFMRHFDPFVGVSVTNFSFRFNAVLRRANKLSTVIPTCLTIDRLPADALSCWKTQRERMVLAIERITFDDTDHDDSYIDDRHTRCAVTVLASSLPHGCLCITAECSICYNSTMHGLQTCKGTCMYTVCDLCYDSFQSCPYCGVNWHSHSDSTRKVYI